MAYQYDYDRCFCIPLPESDSYVVELSAMLGESKDGISQYRRSNCFDFRVWVLEDCVSIAGIMSPCLVMRHNVSFMLLHHWYLDLLSSCHLILHQGRYWYQRYAHVPLLVALHKPEFVFLRLGNEILLVYYLIQQMLELVSLQGNMDIMGYGPLQRNWRKLVPLFGPTWFYLP